MLLPYFRVALLCILGCLIPNLSKAQVLQVPVGTVMAYAGQLTSQNVTKLKAAGWLVCDGSPVFQSQYPKLYAAISSDYGDGWAVGATPPVKVADFNLPDYRGRFLRGVDQSSGRDPDVASRYASQTGGVVKDLAGSVEDDAVAKHNHPTASATMGGQPFSSTPDAVSEAHDAIYPGGNFRDNGASGISRNPKFLPLSVTVNDDPNSSERGKSVETRPKNVSVYWIIKYK